MSPVCESAAERQRTQHLSCLVYPLLSQWYLSICFASKSKSDRAEAQGPSKVNTGIFMYWRQFTLVLQEVCVHTLLRAQTCLSGEYVYLFPLLIFAHLHCRHVNKRVKIYWAAGIGYPEKANAGARGQRLESIFVSSACMALRDYASGKLNCLKPQGN